MLYFSMAEGGFQIPMICGSPLSKLSQKYHSNGGVEVRQLAVKDHDYVKTHLNVE